MVAGGGQGSISVSTDDRCSWTARSNTPWLTITSGASGTGSGVVAFVASPNADTTPRTTTLTIAEQSVSVQQDAAVPGPGPCTYMLSPLNGSFDKRGGTGSVTVAAPDGCSWTATSEVSWLRVTGAAQGTGNGSVAYTVDQNSNPDPRASTLLIAGQIVAIDQTGDLDRCEYTISTFKFTPCMTAQEMTATISTAAACPWTASPGASWIRITRGASTVGSGVVGFTVSENFDLPRAGQILLRWPAPTAGQNLQVSQAGCRYALSRSAMTFGAAGGTGTVDVIQQSDPIECGGATQNACAWSAQSDVPWITITSAMPRIGDDPFAFTVAVNSTSASRSGTITVRDQTLRITQLGSVPAPR